MTEPTQAAPEVPAIPVDSPPTVEVPLTPVEPAEPAPAPAEPAPVEEVKPEPTADQEAAEEAAQIQGDYLAEANRPGPENLLSTDICLVSSAIDPEVWVPVMHGSAQPWQSGSLEKVQAYIEDHYSSAYPGKLYWTQTDPESFELEYEQPPPPEPKVEEKAAAPVSQLINIPVILQLDPTGGTVILVGPAIPPAAEDVLVKAGVYYSVLTDFSSPTFEDGAQIHPAAIPAPPEWWQSAQDAPKESVPHWTAKAPQHKPWWRA
jgi:hypothetical protein